MPCPIRSRRSPHEPAPAPFQGNARLSGWKHVPANDEFVPSRRHPSCKASHRCDGDRAAKPSKVRRVGIPHNQPPHRLLIPDLRPCNLAGFADGPEDAVFSNAEGLEPGIDSRLTPAGTVTVRTRLPFPAISGSTQRPSRCCRSSRLIRRARMARSRSPVRVFESGALRRLLACSFNSQFPARLPRYSTRGTRPIAADVAGSSIPLSTISRASLRMGDSRRLTVEEESSSARSAERYCWTRALVKAGSAPEIRIQVKKAVSPVRYDRLEWAEVTPFRTSSIIRASNSGFVSRCTRIAISEFTRSM